MDLTHTVLREKPLTLPLTEIYRNTMKLVSFMQAAIEDVHDGHNKIESANTEIGEGVECIPMSRLWTELRSLLLSGNYSQSEVAILLESSYTPFQIQHYKHSLAKLDSSITVQSADIFPRTGVIVDSVDSFIGLDAIVCVFILSNTRKTSLHHPRKFVQRRTTVCEMNMYNQRYEVFLVSRAIHKAVFVVPELSEDLVHQMKFDTFPVCIYNVEVIKFLLICFKLVNE